MKAIATMDSAAFSDSNNNLLLSSPEDIFFKYSHFESTRFFEASFLIPAKNLYLEIAKTLSWIKTAKKDKNMAMNTKGRIKLKLGNIPKSFKNSGKKLNGASKLTFDDSPIKEVTTGTNTEIPNASEIPDKIIKKITNL